MSNLNAFGKTKVALTALLKALADDGIVSAGLVVCAIPVRETHGAHEETVIFTALRDDVCVDPGTGPEPPTAPIMTLFEQATRGIKRQMTKHGS
jgi:hypothetical protein